MTGEDFSYWWNIPGDWVEPPNERRDGWSGMLRVKRDECLLYVKRQRNHMCRTLRHPFGWPTASREWHYLQRLRGLGILAPVPLFHDVRLTPKGQEAVLVTEELAGFAALDTFAGLDAERKAILAEAIGTRLGMLHRSRLQHSSLYDKHVMIRWDEGRPEVALIDLEKMRPRLTRRAAASHDLEQFRRRQKVFGDSEWRILELAHARSMRG